MAVLFEAPHLVRTGGSDPFTIEFRALGKTVLPAGHETITRRGARPLVAAGRLTPADVAALVAGVRSVDENLLGLALPSLQRQHFLRATVCQPVRSAYREALARLYNRFEAAVGASGARRFHHAGEALHLIQDSFSEAHTERVHTAAGPTGAIRFVRFYGVRGKPAPVEHKLVGDQRDLIAVASAAARAAHRASTAFLHVLLAAAASGTTKPARALLFARYVRAFVPLDPAHRTTRSVYPACRP
jgi:hypothetical protein